MRPQGADVAGAVGDEFPAARGQQDSLVCPRIPDADGELSSRESRCLKRLSRPAEFPGPADRRRGTETPGRQLLASSLA